MTRYRTAMRKKIGNNTTYVQVDTANNRIEFYVSGTKVAEWG